MKLDWLDAREAVLFAKEIAQEINQHFLLTPQEKKPSKANKNRKEFIASLAIRVHLFAQQHKLNMYKKIKFLDTIKRELNGAGYEEALINELIELLMPSITT